MFTKFADNLTTNSCIILTIRGKTSKSIFKNALSNMLKHFLTSLSFLTYILYIIFGKIANFLLLHPVKDLVGFMFHNHAYKAEGFTDVPALQLTLQPTSLPSPTKSDDRT